MPIYLNLRHGSFSARSTGKKTHFISEELKVSVVQSVLFFKLSLIFWFSFVSFFASFLDTHHCKTIVLNRSIYGKFVIRSCRWWQWRWTTWPVNTVLFDICQGFWHCWIAFVFLVLQIHLHLFFCPIKKPVSSPLPFALCVVSIVAYLFCALSFFLHNAFSFFLLQLEPCF